MAESIWSRRRFLYLTGGGAVALGLGACSSGARDTAAPTGRPGGTLRILASDGSPNDTLDPLRMERAFQILAAPLIYESLVDLDEQLLPVPRLAESFTPAAGGKSWTFRLRTGVTFHDGAPLTPADVAFSITRALDPDAGSGNSLAGQLKGILAPAGIKVVDDRTVRFDLAQAYVYFPNAMATRFARIYQANTTDFGKPVGTGPFRFVSLTAGREFVAARNPAYWRNKVSLDRVVISNVAEDASRVSSLLAGDADLVFEISLAAAQDIKQADGYTILEQANARWLSLALDSTVAPFDKPAVVQAVKLALDRQQIIDNALGGFGTIGYDTPIAAQDKWFGQLPTPKRDVAAAKRLLATAGFPNGLDLPRVVGLSDEPATMAFLQVAQQQLREAGIRFEITPESGATYWDNSWLKKPDYSNTYLRRPPDEIMKLVFLSSGEWHQSRRADAEIDRAINAASQTTDLDQQIAQYATAQRLIAERDSTIVPAHFPRLSGMGGQVRGVRTNPVYFLEVDRATVG
ncbi:MAG TPA: ABC transporter substrate-binding protein [Mycobacteriales bacterium]|nr:ABC transporter substrate-binding protein [Mycobacteriales bacterium]